MVIVSLIINIILIGFVFVLFNNDIFIVKEKQLIKEMDESVQVADLNSQINALNTEHTEYMNYIQTCKSKIADAITKRGIETSNNDNIETVVNNIESIIDEHVYPSVSASANSVNVIFTISEIRNKKIYINSNTSNTCTLTKGQNSGNGNTWVTLMNFSGEKTIDVEELISDYNIDISSYPYLIFYVNNYGSIKGVYAK